MSSENENEWLSAKEIAERGAVAGYPATEKGAMGHAKRKLWPSKVVPGKGGKGGELTLFQPPAPFFAAVEAAAREPRHKPAQKAAEMKVSDVAWSDEQYDAWAAQVLVAEDFLPVRYYSNVAISAGHGALNEGHVPDALLFRRTFLRHIGAHPRQLLLVRVRGDSMHPTLQNRWTVMIDTAKRTVDSGIYAIQSGGQEMVKRLETRPGGIVRVISDNRLYEEYEVDVSRNGDDFFVIGRVIWIAGLI